MKRDLMRKVDPDLLVTLRALFPEARFTLGPGSEQDIPFRFVPGIRRTHMLVPADCPQAAAGAIDRPSASDSRGQTFKRRAVGAVLRSPKLANAVMPHTLKVTPAANSVLDHLSSAVGRDVQFSMAIGSRRANRKPVLTVYADATEVGYAKVGLSSLANQLIDQEATVLHALTEKPASHFRSPRVIHHGSWRSNSVLLMDSLRPEGRSMATHVPITAMIEIAQLGAPTTAKVAHTDWFDGILTAGNQLQQVGRPGLSRSAARYQDLLGHIAVPFGRWHGDLGPWNMVWDNGIASIWDWERSEASAPGGIDSVHFTCHASLRDIGNISRARAVLAGEGTEALRSVIRGLGADSTDDRLIRACLLGYLLSVSSRFSADAERPAGEVVRPLADWYLTVLDDQLADEECTEWN